MTAPALAPRHGADNEKWVVPTNDLCGKRSIGQLVGEIVLAREESNELSALSSLSIANRPEEDRVASLECVQYRTLGGHAHDVNLNFLVDLSQRSKVFGQHDANH